MLGAILLGLVGGLTYTLITLNPGFRFSKLGISAKDLAFAVSVNGVLGGVAGFLGWSLSAGELQPPKSYGIYLLFGVGGGSLIQSLVLSLAAERSKATLERALEAVEVLGRAQVGADANELINVSQSLRSAASRGDQAQVASKMVELANRIASRSR